MSRLALPALVLLLAASFAQAAQWIGPFSVARIETDANAVYFYKGDAFPNSESCATASAVAFEGSETLVNRAISVGLAAKAAKLQVRFYTNGCSSSNYIRAYAIEVMD